MGVLVFLEDLLGRRVDVVTVRGLKATPSSQWSGRSLPSARPPHAYQMIGKQSTPTMPWRRIIGLRSLLAHGYWTIDVDELRREARCQSSSQIFAPLLGDDI